MSSRRLLSVFVFCGLMLVGLLGSIQVSSAQAGDIAQEIESASLVYLVSVREVKVGSGVFVEPIFFTNGDKVYSLVEYCEAVFGDGSAKNNPLRDLKRHPESGFCGIDAFIIPTNNMRIADNFGRSLTITNIRFKADDYPPDQERAAAHGPYDYKLGFATITSVRGALPYKPFPRHIYSEFKEFFLMSDNPQLLSRLVPQTRLTAKQVSMAIKKASAIVEKKKGTHVTLGAEIDSKTGSHSWKLYEGGNVMPGGNLSWGPILTGDADGDGQPDMYVGIRVTFPSEYKEVNKSWIWSATIALFGNGRQQVSGSLRGQLETETDWGTGRTHYVPLAMIRLGGCEYVLHTPDTYPRTVYISSFLQESTASCNGFKADNGIPEFVGTDSK